MIKEMFHYNLWANERIAGVIPHNKADTETPSSFNSLRKTIYHVWGAEELWFQRVHGNSEPKWPSQNFQGDMADALKGWIEHSRVFANYVDGLSEADLKKSIPYKNLKGEASEQTLIEILHHVANHSTFHRGQLVTMMRALGHEGPLPSTDFVAYLRERQKAGNA